MKNAARILAAVAVTAIASAQSVEAQATAAIGARADVQVALSATAVDSLIFGDVFPGTTRSVLPTDASSGSFSLTGAANAEVSVSFTLPANLVGPGGNLPISFGANAASRNVANSRAGSVTFDPAGAEVTRLDAATGELYVFIGGSVSPTTQANGSYTGDITLSAAYTGN